MKKDLESKENTPIMNMVGVLKTPSKRSMELAESAARIMWTLLVGAFVFGAWSATLEVRTQQHSTKIERHEEEITQITSKYEQNQEKLIDILGRMDERLKALEKKNP